MTATGDVRRYRKMRRTPRAAQPAEQRQRSASRIAGWLNARRFAAAAARRTDQAVGLRRRSGRDRSCSRAARGAAARDPARQHRAPADAVAARHPAGCAGRGRAPLHRAAENGFHRSPSATTIVEQALAHARPIRALPRCLRRAAGPRFPSSAASARTTVAGVVDRLVVTPRRGPDRGLQDQPPGAAQPRRDAGALPELCRSSWRSTAPC